jgi:H+-transporting ATPase
MAEAPTPAAGTTPPNHLGTNVPTGDLDEKKDYGAADPPKQAPSDEEEEDEDMDALIEELESQDQNADDEEEAEETQAGAARVVPEELLQTSSMFTGLCHLIVQC